MRQFLHGTGQLEDDKWWTATCKLDFVSSHSAYEPDIESLEQFVADTVLFRSMHYRALDQDARRTQVAIPILLRPSLNSETCLVGREQIVSYGNVLDWPRELYPDIIARRLVVITATFTLLPRNTLPPPPPLPPPAVSADVLPCNNGLGLIAPPTSLFIPATAILNEEEEESDALNASSLVENMVHSAQQGPRHNMEDRHLVCTEDTYTIFAVFDGHSGVAAAEMCSTLFAPLFAQNVRRTQADYEESLHLTVAEVEACVIAAFTPLPLTGEDGSSGAQARESESEAILRLSGSCLCAAVCTRDELFVANLGDSRAVLAKHGDRAVLLTPADHNTGNPDEVARVIREGGRVLDNRIIGMVDGRYSSLLVSRAIGDLDFVEETRVFSKAVGISALPDVYTCALDREEDEFVIVACDGLWDVLDKDEACDVVRQSLLHSRTRGDLQASADALVREALRRGTTDNVTVVLAALPALDKYLAQAVARELRAAAEAEAMEHLRPRFNFGGLKKMIA